MRKYRHYTKKLATKSTVSRPDTRLVDRLAFVVAIIEPLITLPQVLVIFHARTAAGVSLSTWIGYNVLSLIWIWYAAVHRERIILLYQTLFFVTQTLVIAGGVLYGAGW